MGRQSITGLPYALYQDSLTGGWYTFLHLGGERQFGVEFAAQRKMPHVNHKPSLELPTLKTDLDPGSNSVECE